MEAIRYIIKFFFKLALGFFFFAFIWWLVAMLYPNLSYSSLKKSYIGDGTKDWLPAPRQYSGLLRTNGAEPAYPKLYVAGAPYQHGQPYNGYNRKDNTPDYDTTNFVTYTNTETTNTNSNNWTVSGDGTKVMTPTQLPTTNKGQYIRNLSIYEGGHVYTNLSFVGEARSEFFNNGKFPIIMVDDKGMIVGVSTAVATTQFSTPGWVRFETKISYALPTNARCMMIFEEALLDSEKTRRAVRVALPMKCN